MTSDVLHRRLLFTHEHVAKSRSTGVGWLCNPTVIWHTAVYVDGYLDTHVRSGVDLLESTMLGKAHSSFLNSSPTWSHALGKKFRLLAMGIILVCPLIKEKWGPVRGPGGRRMRSRGAGEAESAEHMLYTSCSAWNNRTATPWMYYQLIN